MNRRKDPIKLMIQILLTCDPILAQVVEVPTKLAVSEKDAMMSATAVLAPTAGINPFSCQNDSG